MTSWAYEFTCDKSPYEMEPFLVQLGPWYWWVKDCAWYQDYLKCRPYDDVRICIYQVEPPEGHLYRSVAEIDSNSKWERPEIDRIFLGLLQALAVRDLKEIEAREWPFD